MLFLISGFLISESNAQELSGIPGSFVDIGFGTRPVGMGFAYVGLADDENSSYLNPAGLSQMNEYKVSFSQTDQFGIIKYNYFAALVPLPFKRQSVGFSVLSSGDEIMNELSVHASYGIRVKIFSLGIGVKYRNASFGNNTLRREDYVVFDDSEIDEGFNQQVFGDANGFGVDFGLMIHPTPKMNFGLMVRDVYAPINWNSKARGSEYSSKGSYEEGMPLELIIGSSYKFSENLIAAGDFQPALTSERTNWVRIGIERRLMRVLMLRAGTEQGINQLDDDKYTLGTGLDIDIRNKLRLQSDFAYVIDPIYNTLRFSFAISF